MIESLKTSGLYLVHVELPRQNLRSMSCTGSGFASCANGVISLRVVALARLYERPARTGDPAAPNGAGEQLLLFVVRLLQFTRPSLLLFKFSLCWRTGRAHAAQCNSTRPPPHCHAKITRQTRALVAVVMQVCHTLYSEVVELYFADIFSAL